MALVLACAVRIRPAKHSYQKVCSNRQDVHDDVRHVQRIRRIRHSGRVARQERRFRGILTFVPGRYGIGVLGPALNDKGNSYAGVHFADHIPRDELEYNQNPLEPLQLQGIDSAVYILMIALRLLSGECSHPVWNSPGYPIS